MKKFLVLFILFLSQSYFAQITGEDVKFFVGEGNQTAYLIVDFKDGTDDRSYVWGIHFEEEDGLTFGDFLTVLDESEPNFSHETAYGGAFLNDVIFNSHSGLESDPDYWTTWSGDASDSMSMNSGISESLEDGRWYGLSYGFSNPTTEHPVQPIPAYHSLWFSSEDITTWFGEGENSSIVIVDFGTETEGEADSFAFGIRYNENSISAYNAMELLQSQVENFVFENDQSDLFEIEWNGYHGVANAENPLKSFTGTDLSNWKTASEFTQIDLENNQWLGLSFGERRPFLPKEEGIKMNVNEVTEEVSIYPNPTSDKFFVSSKEVIRIEIYEANGRLVKSIQNSPHGIEVKDLAAGIYFLKIHSSQSIQTQKLIVK